MKKTIIAGIEKMIGKIGQISDIHGTWYVPIENLEREVEEYKRNTNGCIPDYAGSLKDEIFFHGRRIDNINEVDDEIKDELKNICDFAEIISDIIGEPTIYVEDLIS